MRRAIVVSAVVFLALCCLLSAAGGVAYLVWPRAVARPLVLINSPRHGEQVEVGQEVTVHSIARDEGKVVRVELWVDGQLEEAQTSNLPGGTSPFPLLARWWPLSPGTHTLIARAFNAQGGRAHVLVNVEAIRVDRDGDGVADDADLCPDESGPEAASGCPDGDGDSIPDDMDDCPDEPGTPATEGCPDADGDAIPDGIDACPEEPGAPGAPEGDGCPAPTDEDRDGDGIPDDEDGCPDEGGSPVTGGCPDADGDGVRDSEDDCLGEPGPLGNNGCPGLVDVVDTDGDGVRDVDDDCPDMWGLPEHDGCPDRDGDGVPDDDDLRPDEPGRPDAGGAPDTGAGDSDGDGIADDIDPCTEEWGTLEDDGCPPPGEDESPPGGLDFLGVVEDFLPPPLPPAVTLVEFEALEFEVFEYFDEVWCYARLAGGDVERYDFEPLGERQWDIAAVLSGENSRVVAVPEGESVEVAASCLAYIQGMSEPISLGSFSREYPQDTDTWGHVITLRPAGFQVKYRICKGACETAALPAPYIHTMYYLMGEPRIAWTWDGDESMISGFKLYLNGNFWRSPGPDIRAFTLYGLEPPCDERLELQMTAYSGGTDTPDRESPRSNTFVVEGPPCPLPDLTITSVDQHESTGQLRIHVFNNAASTGADLVNEEITVDLVRISTNERIALHTWPNVTIRPGGWQILQSSDLVLEPSDLRVILDPDNGIEEMNEDNNIYETPVRMRVEFTSLQVPEGICEGSGHANAEVFFYLWAGHSIPDSGSVPITDHQRYPWGGTVDVPMRGARPVSWSLEGQDRFTFEFDMPADHDLYVHITGYEQDWGNVDWMGDIQFAYGPDVNYGASSEAHDGESSGPGTTECDALTFRTWEYFGFEATWRITRVQ